MFQKRVVQTKSIKFRVVRLEIRALTRKWAHVRSFIYMLLRFNHCLPGGQDSPFGEGVTRWNLIVLVTMHVATSWSKYIYEMFFQEVLEHTDEQ